MGLRLKVKNEIGDGHKDSLVYDIDHKKAIIGSSGKCDVIIQDPSISSFHVFISFTSSNRVEIIDLRSETGTFVNEEKIVSKFISNGDIIRLGNVFLLVEIDENSIPIPSIDDLIHSNPAYTENKVASGQMILIDGELLNLRFDDSLYTSTTELPFNNVMLEDYIEPDTQEVPRQIISMQKKLRLEIIHYVASRVSDVNYVDLRLGDYFLTNKKINSNSIHLSLDIFQKQKLMSFNGKDFKFHKLNEIEYSQDVDGYVDLRTPLFIGHGIEQVSLRVVNESFKFRSEIDLNKDIKDIKQISSYFSVFFLPFLFLLLLTTPEIEQLTPEVAIIYELPKVLQHEIVQAENELTSSETEDKIEEVGVQQIAEVKVPEQAAPSQVVNPKPAKKTSPPVRVAEAQAPVEKPIPAPPKKTYTFASSSNTNSISDLAAGTRVAIKTQDNAQEDTQLNIGNLNNGALDQSGRSAGVTRLAGQGGVGTSTTGLGVRGIASKKGYDGMQFAQKTVVLGSIDADVLRKILQEYIPQFRHCYQQELLTSTDKLNGVLDLNFTISNKGSVSKYAVESKGNQFSKRGTDCIGKVLTLIPFPEPKGGGIVDVRQPLNFTSETRSI